MLTINEKITIPGDLIRIRYIRSRGPGGQNVNKVNTRAQLSFDWAGCDVIYPAAKKRLAESAGRRLTNEGILILESDRFREQKRNREEVLKRLAKMIEVALIRPTRRIATKPTKASKKRVRQNKEHRSKIKNLRRRVSMDD